MRKEKAMGKQYENKVCVVTGGASGFGYGIAKRLLEYGARTVWLLDYNSMNLAKAAGELSKEYEEKVQTIQVDIAAEGAIEAALDEVVKVSGGLDVLFNNAGRPMTKPVTDITPAMFRSLITLNYTGVVMGTLKAIQIMEAQGGGLIVNAASAGGLVPAPYQCAYASTKSAVITFTRCLAYEYHGRDIRFAHFAPVNVATNIFSAEVREQLRCQGKTEEEIEEALKDVKPPEGAMPLDEALDILFAGLEEGKTDILIGELAEWAQNTFINDRAKFDEIALEMGKARGEYFRKVKEAEAKGEPTDDIPFPG